MPTKKTTKKVVTKSVVAEKAPGKKAPVKKTAKPAAKSAPVKKELVYAADDRSFWVTNGQILNSLVALRDALDAMEKEVYAYHAGPAHNDFASWVGDVLADKACAAELAKATSPKSAKTVIVKHLKFYAV